MARIRLENLSKNFGNVTAVDSVALEVDDGEFLALLGPSGCGKTTMLLMLAGIYKPTEGEIYFDDAVINDVPAQNRGIGLVFQSYALYPHMTVFDNIAFPLRLQKLAVAETRRRVEEMAKLVRIGDLLGRWPSQISGGQQQRVALCRSLVKHPHLLLLDEPLSNLDARLRIETRAELKRIQKELGITTILVTHDQIEAITMAERIAVMDSGVIVQCSPPRELYLEPRNLFVASFVGDPPMNLLKVRYSKAADGTPVLEGHGFALPVPAAVARHLARSDSQELVVGIRPEDVMLSREDKAGAIRGEVFMTEPLGRDTLVDFRFGDEPLRVLAPGEPSVRIGDSVWLAPTMERLHLFDQGTGKRCTPAAANSQQSRLQASG
jgi:ABC-type sugar transport system ATPase subunit